MPIQERKTGHGKGGSSVGQDAFDLGLGEVKVPDVDEALKKTNSAIKVSDEALVAKQKERLAQKRKTARGCCGMCC